MTKRGRTEQVFPRPSALMTDEELVLAADPYVRELLARDLLRGRPDEDGETFTVFLAWPTEHKPPPPYFTDEARPMRMLILKDDTKH